MRRSCPLTLTALIPIVIVGRTGWPAAGGTAGTEAVVEFWFEDDARKMESDPVSTVHRPPRPLRLSSVNIVADQSSIILSLASWPEWIAHVRLAPGISVAQRR